MSQSAHPTRVLAGITVPDTPAITAAIAFARAHSDDLTFNHVMRSWLFGTVIATKLPGLENFDLEVQAVSAILHDLGWDTTGKLVSEDKRFEVDGAIAARQFLDRQAEPKWDERRVQLVWDTIALHTTPSIAQYKEAEVSTCHVGIFMDFVGPDHSPPGTLTWEEYDEIVKEFPRMKAIRGITEILVGLCKTKPNTTYDNFVSSFGEKYVEGYSLEGKTVADLFQTSTLPDSF